MNRRLWENLASLTGLQALNYVVPLVTLPFLTRVLGPAAWGSLAFAEAYANYSSVFIEYGFGLSATREVSRSRDDAALRGAYLSSVLGAQALLCGAVLMLSLGAALGVRGLAPYLSLVPWAFLLAAFRASVPIWYFQAIENMRAITAMSIAANAIAAVSMLVLVRNAGHAWIPLALRTAAAAVSLATSLAIIRRDTPLHVPHYHASLAVLREGGSLFIFRSAVSLYTTANVLLLGVLAVPAEVASFAGAEKLVKAAVAGIGPVAQTFYPRINYLLRENPAEASRTAKVSAVLSMSLGFAFGLLFCLGAPALVRFGLGPGFEKSVTVLRLLAVLPPLIAGSNVLGIQWMLPLRMDRAFTCIIAIAGAINLCLAVTLVPIFQSLGMALSVVTAEAIVTAGAVVVLVWRRATPWSATLAKGAAL